MTDHVSQQRRRLRLELRVGVGGGDEDAHEVGEQRFLRIDRLGAFGAALSPPLATATVDGSTAPAPASTSIQPPAPAAAVGATRRTRQARTRANACAVSAVRFSGGGASWRSVSARCDGAVERASGSAAPPSRAQQDGEAAGASREVSGSAE